MESMFGEWNMRDLRGIRGSCYKESFSVQWVD